MFQNKRNYPIFVYETIFNNRVKLLPCYPQCHKMLSLAPKLSQFFLLDDNFFDEIMMIILKSKLRANEVELTSDVLE